MDALLISQPLGSDYFAVCSESTLADKGAWGLGVEGDLSFSLKYSVMAIILKKMKFFFQIGALTISS
jgi:hypothetical protein